MIIILVLQVFLYLTCTNSYTGFQEVPLDDPQGSNPIDANQLVKWNARYSGDIFWAMKVGHIGACADLCIRMTICASFNFDLDSHMCEMNSNVRDYQTDLLLWKQNSVYSKIQDWPNKVTYVLICYLVFLSSHNAIHPRGHSRSVL